MRPFILAAFLALFAGQVLARINITIAGLGNLTASQFLQVKDAVFTDCQDCANAVNIVQQCGDDNDACLCGPTATDAIHACQQCMFDDLIHLNRRPQDPLAGSAPALAAYATACTNVSQLDVGKNFTTLALPADWDGPFGQGLNTFGTVVSVIAATVLGAGLITVVNTM
ncbi:hypothetical protein GY45DRAFT_1288211 [Cubamyces sp. BRFM 1775]|nr:hypothetical protein GY45DRAFT_1288211 [Cubamyces sp. BRFM 1775]